MSHFTTPLGLTLANPGTGEPFSTAVVNGDFVLLDTAILADRVRLTALEGAGAIRPGSTGGAVWPVTTLAALDALSLAKVGDIAYMSDPGSGNAGSATIDAMKWEAISGTGTALVWRACDLIVTDTKAHLDTFVTALAGTTTLQLRTGNQAYLTTPKAALRWDGATWQNASPAFSTVRASTAVGTTGNVVAVGALVSIPTVPLTQVVTPGAPCRVKVTMSGLFQFSAAASGIFFGVKVTGATTITPGASPAADINVSQVVSQAVQTVPTNFEFEVILTLTAAGATTFEFVAAAAGAGGTRAISNLAMIIEAVVDA